MKKVYIISLGCDKNRVDTEKMLYRLSKDSFYITSDIDDAQIIIINTCAFIESARREAIDTILDAAMYKQKNCEKLIVTGCLPQKYLDELEKELPEVDVFLGTFSYDLIVDSIKKAYSDGRVLQNSNIDEQDFEKRIISTPYHYAYLKIADGCDNHCTFCAIPSIRGKYRSRSINSLVSEAKALAESEGVSEIILVAQDVTRYGYDLYGEYRLIELIKQLSTLDVQQIRLMYCYPELVTDELIDEISTNSKVAKYIDIPFQHFDDKILRLMNRRSNSSMLEELVDKIRKKDNRIAIRTTFMVGFPCEGDREFESLCDFVKRKKLDNIGIFAYSNEDTPSSKLDNQVSDEIKHSRVEILGELHKSNAIEKNKNNIGKVVRVVYEDIDYDRNLFVGRTEQNAPEIDTVVYFSGEFADVGNYYNVKITGYDDYDLIGEITNEPAN